jgi:hypothetical protein
MPRSLCLGWKYGLRTDLEVGGVVGLLVSCRARIFRLSGQGRGDSANGLVIPQGDGRKISSSARDVSLQVLVSIGGKPEFLMVCLSAFERICLATDLYLVGHPDGRGKGMLLSPPGGTVQRKQLISSPVLSMARKTDERSHVPLLTPLLSCYTSFSSILSAAACEP